MEIGEYKIIAYYSWSRVQDAFTKFFELRFIHLRNPVRSTTEWTLFGPKNCPVRP